MAEQNLNLNYIMSRCTVKKDVVTGVDVGYIICCSIFLHFFLEIKMWSFFLCGMLWMVLPSNMLDRNQYEILLQRFPVLTKFFLFRSNPIIKIKEDD